MTASKIMVLSILSRVLPSLGIEIPLSDDVDAVQHAFDGRWPMAPVLYGPQRDLVQCHMTFWEYSIFVLDQQCPTVEPDMLCPTNPTTLDPDLESVPEIDHQANVTEILDEAIYDDPEVGSLFSALHLEGKGGAGSSNIRLAKFTIEIYQIIGDTLTAWPSRLAKHLPLVNSLLSLRDISTKLLASGAAQSNFIGFHLGSIEPSVPGSLHIGGYDDGRILGNVLSFDSFTDYTDSQFGIASVRIGVEEGFLPLRGLTSDREHYPIGPFYTDRRTFRDSKNSTSTDVKLEPGTPYLHLPWETCEPLAKALELTFEPQRNIYLWNYEASHPLFHGPAFLELVLAAGTKVVHVIENGWTSDMADGTLSYATVKIPFALLRPTFQPVTDSITGKKYPAVAYFPCSPINHPPETYEYIWAGKNHTSTLGRAFLQAAFVGVKYSQRYDDKTARYWVAQAPGPANLTRNVVLEDEIRLPNRTAALDAWTKSWSEHLPIHTIDADGKTILPGLTHEPALTKDKKIATGVGVPLGALVIGLLTYFIWTICLKSQRHWKQIKADMEAENEVARKRESIARDRQRAKRLEDAVGSPAAAETSASADIAAVPAHDGERSVAHISQANAVQTTDTDAIPSSTGLNQGIGLDASHRIPRKPLPTRLSDIIEAANAQRST